MNCERTKMFSQFLYFLVALILCSVVRDSLGQNTNFTGPGYIACPFDLLTATTEPCLEYAFDRTCSLDEIQLCNSTDSVDDEPSLNEDGTIAYIPLYCSCFIVSGCNNNCTKFTDDIPTSPPIGIKNFTGVGSLTCPIIDLAQNIDCLVPSFVNDDISSCGTCNPDVDNIPEPEPGVSTFTFPILCDCVIYTCPDTCTFTEGNVTSPTPDVVAPTVPTTIAVPPTAAPGGTGTTSSPTTTPGEGTTMAPTSTPIKGSTPNTTAPISSPVAKTPAAVPTPVVNNSTNGTSSAKLGYSCSTVLFTTVGIIILLSLFN